MPAYAMWKVSNQQMPPGCEAKCISYVAQLASAGSDSLNLSQQIVQGLIDQIQSVFIDNSGNAQAIALNMQGTNQTVTIPGHSQGWVPILVVREAAVFTFTSSGAVNVPFFFVNVPMPAATPKWSEV